MEQKTKIHAEEGKPEIRITRDFDLPVELLFQAHAELFEQWMSHEYGKTHVVKWEPQKQGGWRFEHRDAQGTVVFGANGVFHEFIANAKIIRTFEMENTPFDVQLDFIEFEKLTDDTSRLTMTSIYRSLELRDQLLKLPFSQGLSMAHNRLQDVIGKLK
jgi:uncharacterized protein YndB with AHSA1/START domain